MTDDNESNTDRLKSHPHEFWTNDKKIVLDLIKDVDVSIEEHLIELEKIRKDFNAEKADFHKYSDEFLKIRTRLMRADRSCVLTLLNEDIISQRRYRRQLDSIEEKEAVEAKKDEANNS